ncbi:oxidoreductase yteT [Ceratobasidium sp. AG-Ba]|nr:oxidoreductase yteT [Ceratobasidium sp. AG-Ba]
MAPPTPIKTGIVGVGSSALTFHVPMLLALSNHYVVHSVFERKATQDAKKTGVLDRSRAAAGHYHNSQRNALSFCKSCPRGKKNVLLEKPSQGVVLSAFQNRRWDSDFLTVKKLINEGKLGDITEFESHFDRYRPSPRTTAFWREAAGPGAGHTFDLGPHLIDQVLQLFGRPNRLTGFIQNLRGFGGPAVDDTFLIHFHYDRKPYPIRATVAASSLSVKKSQLRFSVRGSKGSFEKKGLDPQEDQLKAGKPTPLDPQFGREVEGIFGTLDTVTEDGSIQTEKVVSEKGAYSLLFENLADAITSSTEPQVKFEQSAAVIQMIELAMLSSREARTVEVPQLEACAYKTRVR